MGGVGVDVVDAVGPQERRDCRRRWTGRGVGIERRLRSGREPGVRRLGRDRRSKERPVDVGLEAHRHDPVVRVRVDAEELRVDERDLLEPLACVGQLRACRQLLDGVEDGDGDRLRDLRLALQAGQPDDEAELELEEAHRHGRKDPARMLRGAPALDQPPGRDRRDRRGDDRDPGEEEIEHVEARQLPAPGDRTSDEEGERPQAEICEERGRPSGEQPCHRDRQQDSGAEGHDEDRVTP